jgi:hypothetical protein
MLPSHRQAMDDIIHCRTDYFGGHVYCCKECDETRYSYHSCKNRHCPKCGNDTANQWLAKQRNLLLPVIHYLVTFTLPECFRKIARSNQKLIYNMLFRTSAAALQEIAWDPRFVGGLLGMMGVLQTWTRDMRFHPHIHYVVPGGGLSEDDSQWHSASGTFLVPQPAVGKIFRGKFRDALKKTELYDQVPSEVWFRDWVVDCEPVGTGEYAFKYLAPYIFRVHLPGGHQ